MHPSKIIMHHQRKGVVGAAKVIVGKLQFSKDTLPTHILPILTNIQHSPIIDCNNLQRITDRKKQNGFT